MALSHLDIHTEKKFYLIPDQLKKNFPWIAGLSVKSKQYGFKTKKQNFFLTWK